MTDHPEELLALYPDLLEEDDLERVEAHLQQCEACSRKVERLALVVKSAAGLPDVMPDPELERRARQRMLDEARAHARKPRRWALVAAPIAVAALVAAALLLRPPDTTVVEPDEWSVKGAGDPTGEAALQVAAVIGDTAQPLAQGDAVAAGSTLLIGATLTPGQPAIVFIVRDDEREQLWKGRGDATSAEGGALMVDGTPVTAKAPPSGVFELEIWLGTSASDARLAGRFQLVSVGQ